MKNIDILDSWRLVKFVTDLHNHTHSIKGDFGYVKELENVIVKDIENRKVKFDHLVQIANCIFTNNLCSNKIQMMVENELIDKLADFNKFDFDISKFIKLIKCLNNYYIKNEELCERIKNILETYMNGYMKLQQENFYNNEKKIKIKSENDNNDERMNEDVSKNIIEESKDNMERERKIKINKQIYIKGATDETQNNSMNYKNKDYSKIDSLSKNKNISKEKNRKAEEDEEDLVVEKLEETDLIDLELKNKRKKIRTINYEFMEKYNKIMGNISVIFWSLSKNEKFKTLKNKREDFQYFFERMKEMTLKNIEFYNEREITFILKSFRDLNIPLNKSENKNFVKKISSLENFTLHDRVTLLGLFLFNNMGGSLELILKFIDRINENFTSLTFSDMIEFFEMISLVPNLINKIFQENNKEKIIFIEKRLSKIIQNIEIDKFCKLFLFAGKFHAFFDPKFLDNMNKVLLSRINEVPKEFFCKVLFNSINLSINPVSSKLFDILEDLSHFENIKENFLKFDDLNYLLWSCINFAKLKNYEVFDDEINFNSSLADKLINFSKYLLHSFLGLESLFSVEETGNINILINTLDIDEKEAHSSSEILSMIYKNLNEKIINFINQHFNLKCLEDLKEFYSSRNNILSYDKNELVILYFQTLQMLLLYVKNSLYFNLKSDNLMKNNKELSSILRLDKDKNFYDQKIINNLNLILNNNYNDLKEKILLLLSENSIKSDVAILDNFVLTDAASKNEKNNCEEILKNIDTFFAKKPNCSIYQNMIDDYFNAMNISIVFEIPKLEKDQYISGIDGNKYAIIYLNEFYFSHFKKENKKIFLKFYQNRLNILSELFNWKIITFDTAQWISETDKQEFLKEKFGYDMQDIENIKIKILNKNDEISNKNVYDNKQIQDKFMKDDDLFSRKPKYNLAKQILDMKKK